MRDPFIKPRAAPLIGPEGKGRDPRVESAPGPGEWEDPRLGGARGRSLVFPAGLPFPLLCSSSLPWGGMVRPTLLAFPAPLPSGAVAPPPSWHVRLRERAKPWLQGGPDRGGPSGGRQRALPPALLPFSLRRRALRRPQAGRFLSGPGRRGGQGSRCLPGKGATTRAGRRAPGDGGAAATTPGGGVRSEPAGSLERGGTGRGGAGWAVGAGRGADGTTGAGWGGNGTGATMAR